MQSDNTTASILKELEKKSPADLSSMDTHWGQMEAALTVAATGEKNIHIKRWVTFGGSAALLVVILIVGRSFFSASTPDISSQKNNLQANVAATVVPKDSTLMLQKTTDHSVNASKINQLFSDITSSSVSPVRKKKFSVVHHSVALPAAAQNKVSPDINTTGNDIKKKDSVVDASPDRSALLQNLFASLAKKPQQFMINNRRDTVLGGTEGTALYIPAGSFSYADSVMINLKEYYSDADIIMNRLATVSGNEQLITGGMMDIGATKNGKSLAVNKEIPIKVFIPNISAIDSMQVFYAETKGRQNNPHLISEKVNWQLSTVEIDSPVLKKFIRAIDMRDEDFNMHYTYFTVRSKTKAVFIKSKKSVYTKTELRNLLVKKYGGYYDIIKVKRQWDRNLFFKKKEDIEGVEWGDWDDNSLGVGDTANFLPSTIGIYKLPPIDTIYKIVRWTYNGKRTYSSSYTTVGLSDEAKKLIGEKYSIEIDKLGMINCDHFYKSKKPKRDFIIELKDSSYSYYSMLILQNVRSFMPAQYVNDTEIAFRNIPVNESVKLICIGINKKGETVMAMKKEGFSPALINDLQFEKISGEDIKNKLAEAKN